MKSKSLLQPKGDEADTLLTGCFAWPLPQTLGSCHILSLQLPGILRDHALKKDSQSEQLSRRSLEI